MNTVRARFTVNKVVQHKDGNGNVCQEDVHMNAVCGAKDATFKYEYEYSDEERAERDVQSFADATPWGDLQFCINNPHVFGFYEEGKDYYIDMVPVPKELHLQTDIVQP